MISLEVENLSKKYTGKTVLKALSFSHSQGILGISGANGSGKSTLLKCLAKLLKPTDGAIRWVDQGEELDQSEVIKQLGYAAPYLNLYDELTVFENIEFLANLSNPSQTHDSIQELLSRTHILELQNKLFKTLSTGQRQRVKLAASLVKEPSILLLDEPGSNLDKDGHQLVADLVQSEVQKDTLVIIASNDANEMALCNQVISLS
jgi:ABC-type multidrug transport system ATPase subunit